MHAYIQNNKKSIDILSNLIKTNIIKGLKPIVLCIGTPKIIGDSLGPRVGSKIYPHLFSKVKIYGTLQNPVTNLNLKQTIDEINKINYSYIIAVDACLGTNIGLMTYYDEGIIPRAGVDNTSTQMIGHASIVGIVGSSRGDVFNNMYEVKPKLINDFSYIISKALINAIKNK